MGELPQWVRVPAAAKLEDLSLISGTQRVEGENQLP